MIVELLVIYLQKYIRTFVKTENTSTTVDKTTVKKLDELIQWLTILAVQKYDVRLAS